MTLLYLARHAEQQATRDEDPSVGLSETGRRQARLLGERLREVRLDGIHHSPLLRARQTAQLVAESLPDVEVLSSELLTDRTPVPAPGREADYPATYHDRLNQTPDAERDEGGAAISAAIDHFGPDERLSPDDATGPGAGQTESGSGRRGQEQQLLLITHAFVIGWFVRDALDAPVWRWLSLAPRNAGLTVIRYTAERPAQLVAFDDVGHLRTVVR